MNYKKLNILVGWLIFIVAASTYLLTIEPTTSFWDCGEFIASAHKLEVGHPPGAPLFMIAAKVFSMLAGGDTTKVAMMINSLSALASAFTILFLFWTITYFAQKLVLKRENSSKNSSKKRIEKPESEYTLYDKIVILASGAIGALAYTFSDTFWFSAVEGEVYALSSLFTAIVFWAILKWERISDEKYSNRWLIFIAYMMGLSIGVHLLNLLAIPAIVFVYYFKKYETTSIGLIKASAVAIAILAAIMYGIIPGIVKIASWFELLFVNSFRMPYNTGVVFYVLLIVLAIVLGLIYTQKHKKVIANTILASFTVILIGYSSYTMIVVRSISDTPMNENKPDNVFALLSYLNREQYGDRPLLYGQYFNAPIISQETKYTYTQKNDIYEKIPMTNPKYIYSSDYSTLFPRIYSHQSNHEIGYKSWLNISDSKKKPNFITDNIAFFFAYQLNHMYIRYFMWNFAGRQNDYQGHGSVLKGNWISGIPFLDAIRLGDQSNLPDSLKNNKSRNKYYLFPFLLGILGLLFILKRRPQQFTVILLLFFFTGIAIVIYLNQTPYQPRERDYAYAGSFYAFAIWIGLGVIAIAEKLRIFLSKNTSAIITSALCLLLVPGIMAQQNWDDHDRSGRYTARDFAKAYLDSCEPNAILFTYGDNDTFPLWYVQEVEGYRTDVRVVNLSLLGTDWYINQMRKQAYESKPVPFSMSPDKYEQGTRDIIPISNRLGQYVSLKEAVDFVASDDIRTQVEVGGAGQEREMMNYLPANKFIIPVDSAKVIKNGLASKNMVDSILPMITFSLSKQYITKSDMMALDLIANFNWDRPIYFALSIGEENFMGLQNYFQLEGFAYKLVPYRTNNQNEDIGYIDTDILYENLMNKFQWGDMEKPNVLIENYNIRVFRMMEVRKVFRRLAEALINENKTKKAIEVLDRIVELSPDKKIPYDYDMFPIAELYYRLGEDKKANTIVSKLLAIYSQDVNYYLGLSKRFMSSVAYDTKRGISILQTLAELTEKYNQSELHKQINDKFTIYSKKYLNEIN